MFWKRIKELSIRFCSAAMVGCVLAVSAVGCGSDDRTEEVSESLAEAGGTDSPEAGASAGDFAAAGGQTDNASAGGIAAAEMFTERDLSGGYDAAEAERVLLSAGDVTISEEGVYLLSGTLKNGMVIVDTDKDAKVQLVFDGVDIDNDANAAVFVKQADKVFVTLAEGSENSLTSRGYTSVDNNNIDGVIYAKSDLVINGMGSLTVNAVEGHGIVSKDDLKLTGGTVTVTAKKRGLSGRDSVRIGGGEIQITSGKDGIRGGSDENEEGFVYIAEGKVKIVSDGDGISAGSVLQADSGTVDITAGGGSSNRDVSTDENGETVSAKGMKASGELRINGGDFSIDSQDDAIHSNGDVSINGGELALATGDDGIHADGTAAITGGDIDIAESYEGIEGNYVEISGGRVCLYARDDGLNAAGGNDGSGFGGIFGRGERFVEDGSPSDGAENDLPHIWISGGVVSVRADGDGLDSNGDLWVSGGEVYLSGPENGANGALDYEGSGKITGGIVVAAGNSAMAMNFGDASTQGSILVETDEHMAGTAIALRDSNGKEIVSYTAESAFNSVVVSCPELVLGGIYTVAAGEESTEVELDESLIYGSGMGSFGIGGGMPGGGMFRRPEGEMPESPEGGMFRRPEEGMPEMPEGGMPEMPEGEMPRNPEEGMPEMPEGGMPRRPEGEMPEMPEGGVPRNPERDA